MSGAGRLVAKASPMPPDKSCQVREATTGLDGKFTFLELCRDQKYIMNIPAPNLQLSGTIVIGGQEIPESIAHQAWRSPDGHTSNLKSGARDLRRAAIVSYGGHITHSVVIYGHIAS